MNKQEKLNIQHRINHHVRRIARRVPRSKKAGFIMLSVVLVGSFAALTLSILGSHHHNTTHHSAPRPAVVVAMAPKPAPAANPGKYGLSVGEQLNSLSNTQLNAALNDIKSLGVSRLRMDFSWNSIQGSGPQKSNWTSTDRLVNAANARGLIVLGVIDQAPAWARLTACSNDIACAPAKPSAFATFATAVASRYSATGVDEWEIWNEPNNTEFWKPAPNPAAYTTLLRQSYSAIKQANPKAVIVSGGLAPVDPNDSSIPALDYASAMYADGAGPYFNAFGYHPYSFPAYASTFETWNAWSQMGDTAPSIHSIMAAHGDTDKQIWATEYGAPTDGPGAIATTTNLAFDAHPDHISEPLQAAMATNMVDTAANEPWLGPVFWYGYRDQGTNPNTNENFFGLLHYNGSKKPAYSALQTAIAKQ